MEPKIKKVLIAHQSTIPHYRVPFYNELEEKRPLDWTFDVVFDPSEIKKPIFFKEPLDPTKFHFSLMPVHTFYINVGKKIISYQTFFHKAHGYDLIIAENAVNNLAYPLNQIHQIFGKKYALWGHGRDLSIEKKNILNSLKEDSKLFLTHFANGFFAYTPRIKTYLVEKGVSPDKIFVIYNTIDILEQRQAYKKIQQEKVNIRSIYKLENKKVLLYVGRFNRYKRIDFLLKSFSFLERIDPSYHLILVGSNGETYLNKLGDRSNITYFGPITDIDRLASIYSISDVFVISGDVGLGPIQAFCYDLPTITIDLPSHGPEFEYLTSLNSIVLPSGTTPEEYARTIDNLFKSESELASLRNSIWPSMNYLTIDHMVDNFINGVNQILDDRTRK